MPRSTFESNSAKRASIELSEKWRRDANKNETSDALEWLHDRGAELNTADDHIGLAVWQIICSLSDLKMDLDGILNSIPDDKKTDAEASLKRVAETTVKDVHKNAARIAALLVGPDFDLRKPEGTE